MRVFANAEGVPANVRVVAKFIGETAAARDITVARSYSLPEDTNGRFDSKLDRIQIAHNVGPSLAYLVLHEGVHAATVRALHENPGLHKQLYTLLSQVSSRDKFDDLGVR